MSDTRHGYSRSVGFQSLLILAAASLLAGCGPASDAPATIPVTGTVKYKGAALTNGTINFMPVNAQSGRPAQAVIEGDGTFATPPDKGLMVGEYRISILSHSRPLHEIPPSELAELGDSILALPKKYTEAETSGLTVKVETGDREKELPLELTD